MKIEVEMQFLEKRAIEAGILGLILIIFILENSLTELKKNVVFIQRESVKNEQFFEEKLRKEVEKRKVIEKELRQLKAKISTEKV